jgi:outer membrane protein assembly factor BamB
MAPERALRHPLWWIALVVLVVNDHALKGADLLPGIITGKLSDFAGLIVAPVLLAALAAMAGLRGRHAATGAVLTVVAWFVVVKLVPQAASAWSAFMPGTLVADPTDLIALPMAFVAWRMVIATRHDEVKPATRVERALAIAGAVACTATSYQVAAPVHMTDGKLIAHGLGSGPVYVIEPATGRRIGVRSVDDYVLDAVVVNDRIYAATNRAIRGFDLESGKEKVTYVHEGGSFFRRLLTDGTRLIVATTRSSASAHEELFAFDIRSKKLAWRTELPSDGYWRGPSTLPILEGGLVILTAGPELVAYDPATGKRRWRHRASSELTWPAADGRMVFAVDQEGTILALDIESGRVAWRHKTGNAEGFSPAYAIGPRLNVGGGVVAFMQGNQVVGLDAQTGGKRWKGPELEDAAIGRTTIIGVLAADDDFTVAVDIQSGKQLWKAEDMGGAGGAVIADSAGIVLFNQSDGLVAYELANAKVRWRFDFETGFPADSATGSAAPGRVVVPRSF